MPGQCTADKDTLSTVDLVGRSLQQGCPQQLQEFYYSPQGNPGNLSKLPVKDFPLIEFGQHSLLWVKMVALVTRKKANSL
jgi:hypothetical protein